MSLTPTQRGYRLAEPYCGPSIRQRLSGYCVESSPFDTGPPPAAFILRSRGGGEQRAAAPSQLKALINQCYLKRLALPRRQRACSRAALPLFEVALWLCCFHSMSQQTAATDPTHREKLHRNDGLCNLDRNESVFFSS